MTLKLKAGDGYKACKAAERVDMALCEAGWPNLEVTVWDGGVSVLHSLEQQEIAVVRKALELGTQDLL